MSNLKQSLKQFLFSIILITLSTQTSIAKEATDQYYNTQEEKEEKQLQGCNSFWSDKCKN